MVEKALALNILRITNSQSQPLKLALSVDCNFSLPLPEPPVAPLIKTADDFAAAKAQAALNASVALKAASFKYSSAMTPYQYRMQMTAKMQVCTCSKHALT